MTFHRRPYLWILMKIRNFQCSDIDLWPSTKWLPPCLLMRFEPNYNLYSKPEQVLCHTVGADCMQRRTRIGNSYGTVAAIANH